MADVTLLPCKVCGLAAVYKYTGGDKYGKVHVECSGKCHARTAPRKKVESAAADWNEMNSGGDERLDTRKKERRRNKGGSFRR